jgi:hypothetical protein
MLLRTRDEGNDDDVDTPGDDEAPDKFEGLQPLLLPASTAE